MRRRRRPGAGARPSAPPSLGRRRPPARTCPDRSTRAAMLAGPSCAELLQQPRVVLVEHAQVGDLVDDARDALDAHPEREALHALLVVAARGHVVEHVRIDHPRAEDLDPGLALARAAALGALVARASTAE